MDVVIGAGPLGGAVVRELRARGRLVRAVNREGIGELPAEVPVEMADLRDIDVATRVLRDAHTVYLCPTVAATDGPAALVTLVEGVIEGSAAAGAVVAYADTLAAYGPSTNPYREDMQPAAVGGWSGARADAAETLLAAHAAGRIGGVVVRTSDLFGPGVRDSPFGERVFGRLLSGRCALVLGDPDVAHAVTYVEDAARALVTVAELPAALGQVWHAPSPSAVTPREFVELAAAAAEVDPRLRESSKLKTLLLAPFSRRYRQLREFWYTYDDSYLVDDRKYTSTFGEVATPLEDAIELTVAWFRDGGQPATLARPRPVG